MTARELMNTMRRIVRQHPEAADWEVITERHEEWKGYHLYDGFAVRRQHEKTPVVVWRQARTRKR